MESPTGESLRNYGPRVFGETERTQLRERILEAAKVDTPQLKNIDPKDVDTILDHDLDMLQEFERAALPHPQIYSDTDVVFVVSGPGEYSLDFPPYEKKPDRYQHLHWSRKMDRARVRAGVILVKEITAQRLGKSAKDVTSEEILQHGPWLHYSATHWENEHVKGVLAQEVLKFPPEKI